MAIETVDDLIERLRNMVPPDPDLFARMAKAVEDMQARMAASPVPDPVPGEKFRASVAAHSRHAELAATLDNMAKSGELRIRYFGVGRHYGVPVGRIQLLPSSILEIHLGHPQTLPTGTDIAFQERTGFFTVIALYNDAAQGFQVEAENHDHAREVYARTYGAEPESVIAVVPGEIGPIGVYGNLEEWSGSQEWYRGDPYDI